MLALLRELAGTSTGLECPRSYLTYLGGADTRIAPEDVRHAVERELGVNGKFEIRNSKFEIIKMVRLSTTAVIVALFVLLLYEARVTEANWYYYRSETSRVLHMPDPVTPPDGGEYSYI